jgi:hypothetical protein
VCAPREEKEGHSALLKKRKKEKRKKESELAPHFKEKRRK